MRSGRKSGSSPGNTEIGITYRADPTVNSGELDELFAASWDEHSPRDFTPILERSLVYLCAYRGQALVGFVNVAWDGGVHAFILDTTVHPDLRGRGIGRQLVRRAAREARDRGAEWLHVDYEPHWRGFYRQCGFRFTEAGLMRLGPKPQIESASR